MLALYRATYVYMDVRKAWNKDNSCRSKLTWEQVEEIRRIEKEPIISIALRYNVTRQTISKIRNGHNRLMPPTVLKHGYQVKRRFKEIKEGNARRGEREHDGHRSIEWSLSDDEACDLIAAPCHYCNKLSIALKRRSAKGLNGIDRIDSSKGYTSENVLPCCTTCNRAKNVMSITEFALWVTQIYSHLSTWK